MEVPIAMILCLAILGVMFVPPFFIARAFVRKSNMKSAGLRDFLAFLIFVISAAGIFGGLLAFLLLSGGFRR